MSVSRRMADADPFQAPRADRLAIVFSEEKRSTLG